MPAGRWRSCTGSASAATTGRCGCWRSTAWPSARSPPRCGGGWRSGPGPHSRPPANSRPGREPPMRTLADMPRPIGQVAAAPDAPSGLPRLLAGIGGGGGDPQPGRGTPLARHRLVYPAPPRPGRPREDFIAAVERSGLRGRGGASFPTGTKLRAVRDGRGAPVVVVNGSEGEPSSHKDKLLLTMAPHLVIDGALLAAAAVGASEVVVCVDRAATAAHDAIGRALAERGRSDGVQVRLAAIPSRYVAGEETALVHWLNGGPATPTRTPPRPFQRGVDRRPTLIDNVETVAHLAQVLRFGPDWFRQLGTADEPGSALVTLSGAVERPGVYEVPIGAPLAQLVSRAAGAPEGVGAVLLGGYFGSWIGAEEASAASLSNGDLRRHGASLGCGAVVVLGASACRLPDGTVHLLRSALEVFAGDVWRHLDGGSCPAGVRIVPPRTPAAAPVQRGLQWR